MKDTKTIFLFFQFMLFPCLLICMEKEKVVDWTQPLLRKEKVVDWTQSLIRAAQNNDLPTAYLCLANGANINGTDKAGHTALYRALEFSTSKKPTLAYFLIQEGANVTMECKGETPIRQAIKFNDTNLLNLLKENGANPDTLNSDLQVTLCHSAVEYNAHACIEWLYFAGANMNVIDKIGTAPIHRAIIYAGRRTKLEISQSTSLQTLHQLLLFGGALDIQTEASTWKGKNEKGLPEYLIGATPFHLATCHCITTPQSTKITCILLYHALLKEPFTTHENSIPFLKQLVSKDLATRDTAKMLLTKRVEQLKRILEIVDKDGLTAFDRELVRKKIYKLSDAPIFDPRPLEVDMYEFLHVLQTNSLPSTLREGSAFKAAYEYVLELEKKDDGCVIF